MPAPSAAIPGCSTSPLKRPGIDDLGPAPVHPDLLIDSPAVWAVAVPAGIVVDPGIAAVGTKAYVITKSPCLAGKDGCGRLFLDI